ncbi:RNA-dependent ATPase [Boothiomyces sp. JEL0866]|nr:RNA-dependent ATPase [Boothiomyces sp. JEL0866]
MTEVEKKSKKEKKEKKDKEVKVEKKERKDKEVKVEKKEEKKRKSEEKTFESKKVKLDGSAWKYQESEAISKESISKFLEKNEIAITSLDGKNVDIQPIFEFSQANFPEILSKDLKVFPKPTPIQSVTWPPLFNGKDIVGIAATGSGKTMAFGIPGLLHVENKKASKGYTGKPQVLVLSPTRELAMQIEDQFIIFGKSSKVKSVCIYGGVPKKQQQDKLRAGMDAIIATPGRLIDLFEEDSKLCDLSEIEYLVLDEADRMLDAGFEDAIKKIIARLPKKRQTVMFSATWPTSIQKMALSYLINPIKITVGSTDLSANVNIEQRVEVLDPNQKEFRLLALLKDYHKSRKNRILIFALYKKEAARLENFIKSKGYKVGAIHGDLSQESRTRALEAFKDGSAPLLIATDVAARGIDIPNVEYVINVTFPLTVEDYCHRIGRTGRAGKSGISHTFFTVHDKAHSGSLINVLKQAGQPVPPELMKFGTTVKKKLDPNYGAFTKDVDMSLKGSKITFDSDEE